MTRMTAETIAPPGMDDADLLEESLQVLEMLAQAAGIPFNRIVGRQVLCEAASAIGGDECSRWMQCLVEVGESVDLRVCRIESQLDEMLTFVRRGVPVVGQSRDLSGGCRWWVIVAAGGRKVMVHDVRQDLRQTLSVRQFRRLLGLTSRSESAPWLIGQAALSESLHEVGERGHGPREPKDTTPISRVADFLLPERKDITAVVVFSAVVGSLSLAIPLAVESLVNTVAFGRFMQPVVVLSILLFTFLAFSAAIRALMTYVVEILQRRLFVRVVEDLAYRFPRVQQESLDSGHGPELANRFFDIVTVQKAAATLLVGGVALALQTVIGMAVLAFYHPFLLGFDLFLLAVLAFVILVLGRGAVKTAVKESKAKYAVAAWLQELIRHPTAFKLHGGSSYAFDRADQLAVDYLEARKKHFRVLFRQIVFALGLQALAATVLLGLGGWLVIQGQLTLGQLVASELIVMLIVGAIAKAGKHLEMFYDLSASMDKLGQLFDLPTEPHDKLFHLRDVSPASLAVRQVSYCFPSGGDGLKEFDLQVAAGDRLAIVGPPGSGKSILVDLLCGARRPTQGHVELDGIDLREVRPDSLREHLGVARSIEVFHGTIGENVHLNRPQLDARYVREALDTVGLLDEALRFPEGLNTMLQTGGAPFSSSQTCRLMLARAIVSRPRLLVIDGLLDMLPDALADGILDRLLAPEAPWTLLVITHREEIRRRCRRTISLAKPAPPSNSGDDADAAAADSADFDENDDSSCR
jgi:putative ABC transport system ATP-binding protein